MHISNEGILVVLFVGLVAGWLAGKIARGTGFGIIGDILVGIAGALLASLLFPKLGIRIGSGLVSEIVYSTIGAVILLLSVRLVRTGGRMLQRYLARPTASGVNPAPHRVTIRRVLGRADCTMALHGRSRMWWRIRTPTHPVQLFRQPEGEWVGIRRAGRTPEAASLLDVHGEIGRVSMSVIPVSVSARPERRIRRSAGAGVKLVANSRLPSPPPFIGVNCIELNAT